MHPLAQDEASSSRNQLGLWDTISIITGIVVGVAIFRSPPLIFSNVSSLWIGMAIWVGGGLLSLVGACCYAELATTYLRSGGDYVYLTETFGRLTGFLFGWAQLVGIRTGVIGATAYVFADYAVAMFGLNPDFAVWFALAAVLWLTVANILGLVLGKMTQNLLTLAKLTGLVVLVATGLALGSAPESFTTSQPTTGPGFGLAMVLVLYAYGGWNDAALVTSEVHQPQRNMPRALFVGIGIVTLCYLAVNLAYLWVLGFEGLRQATAPAADVLRLGLGEWGFRGMSLLVMVSALGAVNGMILTGSRVYSEMGREYVMFRRLGHWNSRFGTPVWSLVAQAGFALLWITLVGTALGRDVVDGMLALIGWGGLAWEKYQGGFGTLVAATAPVFWFFFLLTGLSLFVSRARAKTAERPFSVPWYPLVPIVFCGMCVYMLHASIVYASQLALLGSVPVLLGIPAYWFSRRNTDSIE
ncbi:MAG: amino acid permease [Pirellulales bacterium]